MLSFPCIVERACRDRAVTLHQMRQFRMAWAGVVGLVVVDPVIMPVSNNVQSSTFEQIRLAFPAVEWNQPRGQARHVVSSAKYLTPKFAQEMSERMICFVTQELPGAEFFEDAMRPPPIYFETDANTYKGVCCVCFKGGCLGRCPNLDLSLIHI